MYLERLGTGATEAILPNTVMVLICVNVSDTVGKIGLMGSFDALLIGCLVNFVNDPETVGKMGRPLLLVGLGLVIFVRSVDTVGRIGCMGRLHVLLEFTDDPKLGLVCTEKLDLTYLCVLGCRKYWSVL